MLEDVYNLLSSRRSVRKYASGKVEREQLERIIKAGTWAPSAHNAQPWRFVVLESEEAKHRLAVAMTEEYRRDLKQNGVPPSEVDAIIAASVERFSKAPVLLLVCLTMEGMDHYPDDRRSQAEHVMAVQSVAAAIQNILLAAHAEELGACWCCAPLFCQEAVRRALKLPSTLEPQALITIGPPAENPPPPPRYPLRRILRYG